MKKETKKWTVTWWILGLIFITFGILNIILIHPVPGIFYLALSLLYIPPVENKIANKLGFTLPKILKIVLALFIIWASMAVGDLMEYFEAHYL